MGKGISYPFACFDSFFVVHHPAHLLIFSANWSFLNGDKMRIEKLQLDAYAQTAWIDGVVVVAG